TTHISGGTAGRSTQVLASLFNLGAQQK
nr:envelope protein 2 variant 660 [Hepacivirus hominis]